MESNPTTKKCPSCKEKVSLGVTRCPYCGKNFQSWFRQHPILTAIIVFFVFSNIIGGLSSLFYSKKTPTQESSATSKDSTSLHDDKPIEPIFNIKAITGKTVSEIEQILGEPSSYIKPLGETYGEIVWKRNGVSLSTQYLDINKPPSGFSFDFLDIKLSFSENDLNKAFQLIGSELTKNKFKNTTPPAFTRYDANNIAGFKKITVLSMPEDKTYISSILFIQVCEPTLLCD